MCLIRCEWNETEGRLPSASLKGVSDKLERRLPIRFMFIYVLFKVVEAYYEVMRIHQFHLQL